MFLVFSKSFASLSHEDVKLFFMEKRLSIKKELNFMNLRFVIKHGFFYFKESHVSDLVSRLQSVRTSPDKR